MLTNLTRENIVLTARSWLGTPWVHQGRSLAGIDCAGLLIRVGSELGVPVEDMQGYRRAPDAFAFIDHIRRQTSYTNETKPGAIAIFRQSNFPCHTGFFAERGGQTTIIHSYMGLGKVIEEPYIHEWPGLLVEARDFLGVID